MGLTSAHRIFLILFVLTELWVKISSSIRVCIAEEYVGGGSVALAVGVSDMVQVTDDTKHNF